MTMATALQVQAIIRSLEKDVKEITQSVADLTAEAAQEVEPQAEKKIGGRVRKSLPDLTLRAFGLLTPSATPSKIFH